MINPYITKEIQNIMKSEEFSYPLNAAMGAAWMSAHFKGENIKIYNVKETSSLADYYIITTVQNSTQAKSLAEDIPRVFKEHGVKPLSIEGMSEGEWVLIDLGDIIVHVFNEAARGIYDLDQLWLTYPQEKIPDRFYFSSHQNNTQTDEDQNLKDYF